MSTRPFRVTAVPAGAKHGAAGGARPLAAIPAEAPFSVNVVGRAGPLVHTFPPGAAPGTYDDLVTVVVRKANAIVYVGFEQTKQTGQRADSASKVKDAMKVALGRLG